MKKLFFKFSLLFVVLTMSTNILGMAIPLKYSGGQGTEADPYLISTEEDLIELSLSSADWGSHFLQTDDIDFGADEALVDWDDDGMINDDDTTGFSAIGNSSIQFTGSYDGQNFNISNLYVNYINLSYTSVAYYAGLFGYVTGVDADNKVQLANIHLNDVSITVDYYKYLYSGALVGYAKFADITNCSSSGSIDITTRYSSIYGGGLVARIYNNVTISRCNSSVSVIGEQMPIGSTSSTGVGGLVGAMGTSSSIEESYATGDLYLKTYTSRSCVGGLLGHSYSNSTSDSCFISNCYATGAATAIAMSNDQSNHSGAGGLVGSAQRYLNISNCYATGFATGTSETASMYAGEFCGYFSQSTITNCYCLDNDEALNPIGTGATVGVAEKAVSEMTLQALYINNSWDFDSKWGIISEINNSYPVHKADYTWYNINYENVGTRNADNNPAYYAAEGAVTLAVPNDSTGYTFKGWYTNAICEDAVATPAIAIGSTGDKTFYAKWKKMNTAPEFTSDAITTATEDSEYNYAFTVNDDDGDELSYDATTLPDWLALKNDTVVSTYAGSGVSGLLDSEDASQAQFDLPYDLAVDDNDNVFVADFYNHCIRKITPEGIVSTFAGNGETGLVDGTGTEARFHRPQGITIDQDGNMYVTDVNNNRVRKVTPQGVVSTVATISSLGGITIDSDNTLYVTSGEKICKISESGVVSDFAGSSRGYLDATGTSAKFYSPFGIAIDKDHNLYVSDRNNNCIRKITPAGVVSTLAGAIPPTDGSIVGDFADGTGRDAKFDQPYGISIYNDELYVCENSNKRIRKVTLTGKVTTLAGNGQSTYKDGSIKEATFMGPVNSAFNSKGEMFIVDLSARRIRKLEQVTTLYGTPENSAVGSHDVVLTACDGRSDAVTQSFSITVTNTNDAPTITTATTQNIDEDGSIELLLSMTDGADEDAGQTPTLVVETGSNYTVSGTTVTPSADFNGTLTVPVKVTDGDAISAAVNMTINVAAKNDNPVCTVSPSLEGTTAYAATLNANKGTWNDDKDGETSEISYTYQWQSANENEGEASDIAEATTTSLLLNKDLTEKWVRVKVTATDNGVGTPLTASAVAYSAWSQIEKKELSITPNASNKTYDGTVAASVSFDNNREEIDDLTVNYTAATFESANAGKDITVNITGISLSGNDAAYYTLANTTANTTANITKKELTVTADDKNRSYGDDNPELTLQYDGFVAEESAADLDTKPTASTTATATTNVGTVDITVAGGVDNNYDFTYVKGTFSINTKVIDDMTFAAIDDVVYNGTAHTPTPELSLDLGAEDCIWSYTNNTNAGTATIKVEGKDNYKGEASTTFTIKKAILTVTADDKDRSYGEENPELTLQYEGFVAEESAADLDTKPTASTTATVSTDVGTVDITVAGGVDNNYDFTYVKGTFSVNTKAIDDMTFAAIDDVIYNGAEHKPTPELSLDLGAEDCIWSYTNNTNAGTATIKVEGKDNYKGEASTTFTIKKAKGDIDWSIATSTINKATSDEDFTLCLATSTSGTVTYASNNTDVATINSASRLVSILSQGEATITATAAATENYEEASATMTISVSTVTAFINATSLKMSIYPNPANQQQGFTLSLNESLAQAHIEIYNLAGQQVLSQQLYSDKCFVNTSGISSPGMYVVRCFDNNKMVSTAKLIIR